MNFLFQSIFNLSDSCRHYGYINCDDPICCIGDVSQATGSITTLLHAFNPSTDDTFWGMQGYCLIFHLLIFICDVAGTVKHLKKLERKPKWRLTDAATPGTVSVVVQPSVDMEIKTLSWLRWCLWSSAIPSIGIVEDGVGSQRRLACRWSDRRQGSRCRQVHIKEQLANPAQTGSDGHNLCKYSNINCKHVHHDCYDHYSGQGQQYYWQEGVPKLRHLHVRHLHVRRRRTC